MKPSPKNLRSAKDLLIKRKLFQGSSVQAKLYDTPMDSLSPKMSNKFAPLADLWHYSPRQKRDTKSTFPLPIYSSVEEIKNKKPITLQLSPDNFKPRNLEDKVKSLEFAQTASLKFTEEAEIKSTEKVKII